MRQRTKLFESFINENSNFIPITWEITSPITSVKNSKGVEFKIGDLCRIIDYHPKYEKIKEFKIGKGGNMQVFLETYDLSADIESIEKQ